MISRCNAGELGRKPVLATWLKKGVSMCFVQAWSSGVSTKASAPWLSPYRRIGLPGALDRYLAGPSSINSPRSQTACLAPVHSMVLDPITYFMIVKFLMGAV